MGRPHHRLSDPGWWFWTKVDRRGPDECWPWTDRTERGYGRIWAEGRQWRAHQLAYRVTYGTPSGIVCHRCGNRICCNPSHLYDGTPLSNTADRRSAGVSNGRPGTLNHEAKLTAEAVAEIRSGRESQIALARRYGVTPRVIWLCVHRRSYKEQP